MIEFSQDRGVNHHGEIAISKTTVKARMYCGICDMEYSFSTSKTETATVLIDEINEMMTPTED